MKKARGGKREKKNHPAEGESQRQKQFGHEKREAGLNYNLREGKIWREG